MGVSLKITNVIFLYVILFLVAGLGFGDEFQVSGSSNMLVGPKLRLDYQPESVSANPVHCFMYFVPLTSPTSVTVATDPGTTFTASITSWKTTQKGDTVHVECNFDVTGRGGYCASYDSDEMIRHSLDQKEKVKEITKLLEWIRLDGPCKGRIKGYGKIVGDDIQMQSVEICFNRDNTKSPVQVSIYDIPKVKGEFLYENRKNCQVARINSLKFNCDDDGTPCMGVELASVTKPSKGEGLFSRLTAMIANILSTSTPVAPAGNTAVMDFGVALYEKKPVFTFPAAANIHSNF